MKDEMNIEIELCSTKYVRKLFRCGNKKVLELFHRPDFPGIKVGRAFYVKKSVNIDINLSFIVYLNIQER